MQNELLVIPKCTLDLLDLSWLQLNSESLVKIILELGHIKFLAHVYVPIRFRNEARNQPICVIEVFFISHILSLWSWHRSQEVRSEEVRL